MFYYFFFVSVASCLRIVIAVVGVVACPFEDLHGDVVPSDVAKSPFYVHKIVGSNPGHVWLTSSFAEISEDHILSYGLCVLSNALSTKLITSLRLSAFGETRNTE